MIKINFLKKIGLIVFIITIICLLFNNYFFRKPYKYIYTPTPLTDKKGIECEKSGGDWLTGPFGKEYFCNKKLVDGGKTCNDSSDCLSDKCILYKGDNIAKCASYETVFGCYSLIIKNSKQKSICVD